MEWDRRHSAFLYQLLSGGQLMYRDKLHYEALIRTKQHTSPKTLDRASSSIAPPHAPRGAGHAKMPSNGGSSTVTISQAGSGSNNSSSSAYMPLTSPDLRKLGSQDDTHQQQSTSSPSITMTSTSSSSTSLSSPSSTTLSSSTSTASSTSTHTHLSHHHRGHQRRPSAAVPIPSAASKEEALRDRRMEAKLLAIKLCWEVIAWSNEGWVWVALSPLFLMLSFFYLDPITIAKVKYLYIMLLVDILLTGGIKYATKRTRPSYNRGGLFVGPDIFSFPSGHSSRAMLLVHVSIFVFGWRSLWSNIAVSCWAMLVAISRLALGRHFLTDVMGGLTLGALEFWATFVVLQQFMFIA